MNSCDMLDQISGKYDFVFYILKRSKISCDLFSMLWLYHHSNGLMLMSPHYIIKGWYTGTGTIVWLSQWSDLGGHGNTWWRHQIVTFSALLSSCAGNSPVNSPHKGQWRGALMFSLICAWTEGWVNNRDTGDLRHHRAYYDVTVMIDHCQATTKHNNARTESIIFTMYSKWAHPILCSLVAQLMTIRRLLGAVETVIC